MGTKDAAHDPCPPSPRTRCPRPGNPIRTCIVFLDAGGGNARLLRVADQAADGPRPEHPRWVQHIAQGERPRDAARRSTWKPTACEVLGVTDHGAFHSIYFFDLNGHRVELACPDPEFMEDARAAGRGEVGDAQEWSQTSARAGRRPSCTRARVRAGDNRASGSRRPAAPVHRRTEERPMTNTSSARRRCIRRWRPGRLPALAQARTPASPSGWVVGCPAGGGGSDVVAAHRGRTDEQDPGPPHRRQQQAGRRGNIAADYVAKSRDVGHHVHRRLPRPGANPALFAKLPLLPRPTRAGGPAGALPAAAGHCRRACRRATSEFMAWAQAQRDGVRLRLRRPGSPHHLALELFRERTGLQHRALPRRRASGLG